MLRISISVLQVEHSILFAGGRWHTWSGDPESLCTSCYSKTSSFAVESNSKYFAISLLLFSCVACELRFLHKHPEDVRVANTVSRAANLLHTSAVGVPSPVIFHATAGGWRSLYAGLSSPQSRWRRTLLLLRWTLGSLALKFPKMSLSKRRKVDTVQNFQRKVVLWGSVGSQRVQFELAF